MAENTANLRVYFNQLCDQSDFALAGTPPACNTSQLSAEQWPLVVQAGYNDIDRRCDAYLSWLQAKQGERFFANQGFAALTGLLGGVAAATGAADALAWVALTLGFGATMYNAYQDTLLMGLEFSTIKTIVMQRREAFRSGFKDEKISSKPDAVFVLRSYLRICTPASITMDVNTFSRDGVLGISVKDRIADQVEAEKQALLTYTPLKPDAPVTPQPRPLRPTPPELSRVFSDPGFTNVQLLTLQGAFCIPETDRGNVGPITIANVNMIVSGNELNPTSDKNRISDNHYDDLLRITGGTCDLSRHRNAYENTEYLDPASEKTRLADIKALFGVDPNSFPLHFADTGARPLIGRARATCGLPNEAGHPFADQVTPDLASRLDNNQCGVR